MSSFFSVSLTSIWHTQHFINVSSTLNYWNIIITHDLSISSELSIILSFFYSCSFCGCGDILYLIIWRQVAFKNQGSINDLKIKILNSLCVMNNAFWDIYCPNKVVSNYFTLHRRELVTRKPKPILNTLSLRLSKCSLFYMSALDSHRLICQSLLIAHHVTLSKEIPSILNNSILRAFRAVYLYSGYLT